LREEIKELFEKAINYLIKNKHIKIYREKITNDLFIIANREYLSNILKAYNSLKDMYINKLHNIQKDFEYKHRDILIK